MSSSAAETHDNDKRRVGRGAKAHGLTLEGQTMLEKLTTQKWQDLLNLRIGQEFEECWARIFFEFSINDIERLSIAGSGPADGSSNLPRATTA